MITPTVYQLALIAELAVGAQAVGNLEREDLKAIEIGMRRVDPEDTSRCSPHEVSHACLVGASTAMAHEVLGEDGPQFAVAIVHWTLSRNGYTFAGDSTTLVRIVERLGDLLESPLLEPDETSIDALERRVRVVAPTLASWRGWNARAYIISALTGVDERTHEEVLRLSDSVATVLEELGIWTHLPARYTNPNIDSSHPPDEVRSLDYGLVINSDLCVFVGGAPTTGGGEELAWADAAGIPVVMLSSDESSVSKLVRGTTGKLSFVVPENLDSGLRNVMNAIDLDVRARYNVRQNNVRLYSGMAEELRERLELGEVQASSILTRRRVEEMSKSAEHIAQSPIWQVEELSRIAGIRYGPIRVLDHEERDALAELAREESLDSREVLRLADAAQTLLAAHQRFRGAGLRTTDAWKRFRDGI